MPGLLVGREISDGTPMENAWNAKKHLETFRGPLNISRGSFLLATPGSLHFQSWLQCSKSGGIKGLYERAERWSLACLSLPAAINLYVLFVPSERGVALLRPYVCCLRPFA